MLNCQFISSSHIFQAIIEHYSFYCISALSMSLSLTLSLFFIRAIHIYAIVQYDLYLFLVFLLLSSLSFLSFYCCWCWFCCYLIRALCVNLICKRCKLSLRETATLCYYSPLLSPKTKIFVQLDTYIRNRFHISITSSFFYSIRLHISWFIYFLKPEYFIYGLRICMIWNKSIST